MDIGNDTDPPSHYTSHNPFHDRHGTLRIRLSGVLCGDRCLQLSTHTMNSDKSTLSCTCTSRTNMACHLVWIRWEVFCVGLFWFLTLFVYCLPEISALAVIFRLLITYCTLFWPDCCMPICICLRCPNKHLNPQLCLRLVLCLTQMLELMTVVTCVYAEFNLLMC